MKIGFIDYFLDEWHANNYPGWIKEASNGKAQVAYAYAAIDSPNHGGLTTKEWCKENEIQQCESIEELIEKSDVLLVLSPDNPEQHEELSKLALQSGKRTFIDKTFSPDKSSAVRMFDLAKKYNTPCYSTSALRFAKEYEGLDKIGIDAISSWGGGYYDNYSVHQIEPIIMLMGGNPEDVCYIGTEHFLQLSIRFDDGRIATLSQFISGSPFMMNICTKDGNKVVEIKSDFFKEFIKDLIKFYETGVVPVSSEDTIKIMAVREAGLKASKEPGTWIKV